MKGAIVRTKASGMVFEIEGTDKEVLGSRWTEAPMTPLTVNFAVAAGKNPEFLHGSVYYAKEQVSGISVLLHESQFDLIEEPKS